MKKLAKSNIALGNKALRDGDFSSAMFNYILSLEKNPGLARVLENNIRLTQRFFKKSGDVRLLKILTGVASSFQKIFDEELSRKQLEGKILTLVCANGRCEQQDDFVVFNAHNLGVATAHYVSERPSTYVYIDSPTVDVLLMGWMYRIIWDAKVFVFSDASSFVSLDRYFNETTDIANLALIAMDLQNINKNLLGMLGGHSSSWLKTDVFNWPKKYQRLEHIYNRLTAPNNASFLEGLFDLALGRAPQSHENKHYLGELEGKRLDRKNLLELVFSGEESRRHLSDNIKVHLATQVYPDPMPGEIDPSDIEIPLHANPMVSVLIPVYEKSEYTLACLKSISENIPETTFEILVLDDKSPDGSASTLKKVRNLRVIENKENLGFLRSCNNGAKYARGEYLFFLNNDTQVKAGWLDELLLTFENFPGCGLAGSKLIFPDGKLQEAGGIIWKDGSAWNYGRGDDPSKPEYNYAREVDYCSGAAILVPRQLFFDLGCFDERYVPAYCEDSDFALTVRKAGYRVIYQPLSEVIHFEGVSSGTDLTAGIKAYQVANSKKQYEKWAETLKSNRPNAVEPWLERDRGAKGRVLFIDACTPTPDKDSGSIDTFNLMIMFRELGFSVSFIPEDNFAFIDGYTQSLQRNGFHAIYHPYSNTLENYLLSYGDNYDFVMIFRPNVAERSMSVVRHFCPRAKIVFNTVDLHFLRLEREAKLRQDISILVESERYKRMELDLIRSADLSTVISAHELDLLKSENNDLRLVYLPYSRGGAKKISPFDSRDGIIFVGGFQHSPNVDAVEYFCREIWSLVLEQLPNAVLHVVGSNCPDSVRGLASENVIVHGFVKDLEPLLQSVKVNIVPLRFGAGIKGKLGGAMAAGLPSVSSSVGVEGMNLLDGQDGVFIADKPFEFACHIVSLVSDKAKWDFASKRAKEFAEYNWGSAKLYKNLETLFSKINLEIPKLCREVKIL